MQHGAEAIAERPRNVMWSGGDWAAFAIGRRGPLVARGNLGAQQTSSAGTGGSQAP